MPPKFHHMLFHSETPEGLDKVKALYCGRQEALQRTVNILREGLELPGQDRQDGADKTPWVIHGETRSGKSHFARVVMSHFSEAPGQHQMVVRARERLEAVVVMADLFTQYHQYYLDTLRQFDDFHLLPVHIRKLLLQTTRFMDDVERFSRGAGGITLTTTHAETKELKTGFKILPKLLKFVLNLGVGIQDSTQTSISLRPPTAGDYATYVGFMVEMLALLDLSRHVLFLVDDADLLENEFKNSPEARRERSELAEALVRLHRTAGVDVVITTRSLYARSHKEFFDLIDLSSYPMPEEEMMAIYAAHLKFYQREEAGSGWGFLEEETLREAARLSKHLPGIFLKHLKIAFDAYDRKKLEGKMNLDWYLGVFRELLTTLGSKYPAPIGELEACVRSKSMQYHIHQQDYFYGTELDNVLVCHSYYDFTTYQIMPMAVKLLSDDSHGEAS